MLNARSELTASSTTSDDVLGERIRFAQRHLATRGMNHVSPPPHLEAALAFLAEQTLPSWCDPTRLVLCLHLDVPSPSNNVIKAMHFHEYKKLRSNIASGVAAALGAHKPRALPLSALFIVRRSAGSLDWDNAIGGLKPLLDCLVQASVRNPSGLGIIEDDRPRCMPYPPMMKQLPAKKGEGSTQIFVFEVDAE